VFGVLGIMQRWLSARRAPVVIVAIAVALAIPSLTAGRSSDDFVIAAADRDSAIALGHAPFDRFAFATGDEGDAARLRDRGVFPWWADGSARLHFFRPLASLDHTIDQALSADSPALEHAHNIAWYALAVAALWLVLRRGRIPRWAACFALLLYALDQTHGAALSWIANRNGLMAAAFGFGTLWAHDRWRRDGWRPGIVVGPALFGLAMASAEGGVAVLGYLAAFALFMDGGRGRDRLRSLAPYVAVALAFVAIYRLGSFGASHTTQYIDPIGEPGRFASAVVARLPIFVGAVLGGPPSDAWVIYPMISWILPIVVWLFKLWTMPLSESVAICWPNWW